VSAIIGGLFKTEQRLYVNERDQTRLVAGFAQQINAVLEAIGDAEIPINAALCFVDSEWGFFAKPFQQGGVWVTWPTKVSEMIAAPGPLSPVDVAQVSELLASQLPSAVPVD
jgi:hypothetical protein